MIINGSNWDERMDLLAKTVADKILSGINTDKILILCQNSFKKEKITEKILSYIFSNNSSGFASLNISTFAGLAYNSISKNWIQVENILQNSKGDTQITPTLCGLDATQYFFQKAIKEENFDDYFSKRNLMHQLLRRYKLIVENSLDENEIQKRADILSETFADNAAKTIKNFKNLSAQNRFFDNLKQTATFLYLLKNNKIHDFDNIKYFFADDADEYSFATFEFCKYMINMAQESYIYLDKNGCTRQGYLCGYPNVYDDLKKEFLIDEKNITNDINTRNDANNLYKNMLENESNVLNNFENSSYSKYLEMVESVGKKITELLNLGTNPNDIAIITPLADENLLYCLKEFFRNNTVDFQLLTGNKKIVENIYIYAIITILELINTSWNIKPNEFDIRILLNEILLIPIYECEKYISLYKKKGILEKDENNDKYNMLVDFINKEEIKNGTLVEQFENIFKQIIAPNMKADSDFEPINLFVKSINEFEKIKENFEKYENIDLTHMDWLLHIKNSVVSQNPSKPAHIKQNSVIISTAQKIVDFSLKTKYQLWLDTTSGEWLKEDTGTIYNSWVFQKNFNNNYSCELNKKLTVEKNARLLRKLTLCTNKVFTFSSIYDTSGRENNGELAEFITTTTECEKEFKFIPRDDQQEILNYISGKMAVPAVPGAGKTTIMLALLIELVKKGINPQNILVLTYMESAAKNFLNRYKKATNKTNKLPQISTIHAFAFKILMENNNYAFVNLPEDFSICDDGLKTSIIKDICAKNLPVGENPEDYSSLMTAGISKIKINHINKDVLNEFAKKDMQVKEFSTIFNLYIEKLKELSLLDYDDLLVYAVKLLKENDNIAKYYQDKFKIIIEDEAQDSSSIQQEFINILSAKNNNVIRCGDINQAILGTFSNSDVQGFKDFINNNKKVEMFRSQRCSKKIYSLANSLIDKAKEYPVMQNAFYDLKMQEVAGKNPISSDDICYKIFEKPIDEKDFVLNDISSKLQDKNKLPTIAVLLRTNKQVSSWASFIENRGLNVLCRGDSYKQKQIFKFILCAIEVFANPWNNKLVAQFYKEFCNIGKFKYSDEIFARIENTKQPIMNPQYIKTTQNLTRDFETFWWEVFSIIESKTLDIQEIVILCANRYFDDIIDRSNAYLFSILVKRYTNTLNIDDQFKLNYIPEIIKYFKNLLFQKTLRTNFFAREDEDEDLNGLVQVMTIHKAKGAEFDYVYLPEFTDYNYSLNFSKLCEKINKRKKTLLSKLDKIIFGKEKLVSDISKEEIDETLRLIYVAITRAKLGLLFSYSSKNEYKKDNFPVEIIENLV